MPTHFKTNRISFIYISRQGEDLQGQGQGRFFKNVYNVTDNKKCLFVSLESPKTIKTDSKRVTYGFDLSLVKHEFNIKDEFAKTEIKLEHRGFLESLLYEPYLDVLGGKGLLAQRKIIEQEIIKKMVEQGCTKEDIKEAQENLSLFNRSNLINYKSRITKRLINLKAIHSLKYNPEKYSYLSGSDIPANPPVISAIKTYFLSSSLYNQPIETQSANTAFLSISSYSCHPVSKAS